MKKKLFLLFLMLLACGALFAQGSTELLNQMASMTGTGASIGAAIGGPVGAVFGAVAGYGIGAISGSFMQESADEAERLQYKQSYLQSKATEVDLQTQIDSTQLAIDNAKTKISGYDQAISQWGDRVSLQEMQYQQQGESQYAQLMGNFANTQMAMAQKGQTGGSAAIISDIAKQQVQDFAGSNMTLTTRGGGTFAKILEQNKMDLTDQYKSTLLGKQDLYSAIENYKTTKETTQTALAEQQDLTADYRKRAGIKEN